MTKVIGLDIGGANTKACLLEQLGKSVFHAQGTEVSFEVWKDPQGLREVLADLQYSPQVGFGDDLDGVAVTLTAELCDVFESKAQGVVSILQIAEEVFADIPLYVWTTRGVFVSPEEIRKTPLLAAAANWLASAQAVAQSPLLGDKTAILADLGSTTADLIPLAGGQVLARGRTDSERLAAGELVYTGLLRTAVNSMLDHVYYNGVSYRIVKEYFAATADVYRLLGKIKEEEYCFPAADGGGRDAWSCARRLARVIACEAEELGLDNVLKMARYVQKRQIDQIEESLSQILSGKEMEEPSYLITAGQGSFILEEAARRFSWQAKPWWLFVPGSREGLTMTAYCVAALLSTKLTADKGF